MRYRILFDNELAGELRRRSQCKSTGMTGEAVELAEAVAAVQQKGDVTWVRGAA
jgi:hypothetical protein